MMLGLSAISKASEVVTSSHYAVAGNDEWQVQRMERIYRSLAHEKSAGSHDGTGTS